VKAKRKGAILRVDLQGAEPSVLTTLFDDFAVLLQSEDEDDPALARLYPAGYTEDEAASAEYREMVMADLRDERDGRLRLCRAEVATSSGRLELDDEAADRWIKVLNDLRLTLGTRLGVSEEVELDPREETTALYHWLSSVQELLVTHLMA
jgi:hypothetical protein